MAPEAPTPGPRRRRGAGKPNAGRGRRSCGATQHDAVSVGAAEMAVATVATVAAGAAPGRGARAEVPGTPRLGSRAEAGRCRLGGMARARPSPSRKDPTTQRAPEEDATRAAGGGDPAGDDRPPAGGGRAGAAAPRTQPDAVHERPAPAADDDDAIPCAVFDEQRGRPCGEPVESDTLTCAKHRVRPTRTQISRNDAARRRFGG